MTKASGFNLYIDVTTACDAACPWCIAESVGRKDGPGFMAGLAFGLDYAHKKYGTVQIVGGEPTISKRFPAVLSAVAEYPLHRKVVNTNGRGVSPANVRMMVAAGIHYTNISRHHYDGTENAAIMRFKRPFSNAALCDAIGLLQDAGIAVRLNTVMLRGRIGSSPYSVRQMLQFAAELGVKSISLSEMFPLTQDYQRPLPGYDPEDHLDPTPVVEMLDSIGDPVMPSTRAVSYWGGSNWISDEIGGSGKVRFWHVDGLLVSVKALSGYDSNGLPIPAAEFERAPEQQAIVHPDGLVTTSWDRGSEVLYTHRILEDA